MTSFFISMYYYKYINKIFITCKAKRQKTIAMLKVKKARPDEELVYTDSVFLQWFKYLYFIVQKIIVIYN